MLTFHHDSSLTAQIAPVSITSSYKTLNFSAPSADSPWVSRRSIRFHTAYQYSTTATVSTATDHGSGNSGSGIRDCPRRGNSGPGAYKSPVPTRRRTIWGVRPFPTGKHESNLFCTHIVPQVLGDTVPRLSVIHRASTLREDDEERDELAGRTCCGAVASGEGDCVGFTAV